MPEKKKLVGQRIADVEPDLALDAAGALGSGRAAVAKFDLVTNTWWASTLSGDGRFEGLEGQVGFWREFIAEPGSTPGEIEEFERFVEERVAPYYPGILEAEGVGA